MIKVRNAISAAAIILFAISAGAAHDHEGPSYESFASAQSAASESCRPMLVNFGGPGCGPCERLRRETLSDTAVGAMIAERFEAAQVNAGTEPELATRFLVHQFPTVKFMDADGTVVHDHRGFAAAEEFLEVLKEGYQAHEALVHARALAAEAGEEASAEVALEIARSFLAAQQYESAARWARPALEEMPEDAIEMRADAAFVLGFALVQIGEPRPGGEHLESALSLAANAAWAWEARVKLGYAWLQTDRREAAAELLREVAETEEVDRMIRYEARLLLRWAGLEVP